MLLPDPGRQDVAEALGAEISTGQQVASLFERPAFLIPRYTGVLRKVSDEKKRAKDFRKGAAARIDDGKGFPTFAELLVLDRLRAKDWRCAWFSAFGSFQCIDTWPWDADKPELMAMPKHIKDQIQEIADVRQKLNQASKSSFHGITDVVAWRDGQILMLECKRSKEDRLRRSQEEWLHAATAFGLPNQNLGVFEWRFPN